MFNKFTFTCVSVTLVSFLLAVLGSSLITHSTVHAQGKGGGKGGGNNGGGEAAYSVTEMPGTGTAFDPSGISDPDASGTIYVVGQYQNSTPPSWVWTANTDGDLLSTSSLPFRPHGVNSDGVVAGFWGSSTKIAAVWQEGNFYWGLPKVNGGDDNEAWDINNNWEVVGREWGTDPVTGQSFYIGVYWRLNPDGTVAEARSLGSFLPVKMCDTGLAAGRVDGPPFPAMADLNFDPPAVTVLDMFPTATEGFGIDVNNLGEVTGHETYEINRRGVLKQRAFHWTAASGIIDLGTFAKDSWSKGWEINDAGHIVGTAPDKHSRRAYLWDGSEMLDLNDLIPGSAGIDTLYVASGINSVGQIACRGVYEGGTGDKIILLTPLP